MFRWLTTRLIPGSRACRPGGPWSRTRPPAGRPGWGPPGRTGERPQPVDGGLEGLDGTTRLRVHGDVDADGPALPEGGELGGHQSIRPVLVDGVLVAHHGRDLAPSIEADRDTGDGPGAARSRGRFGSGTTGTTPSGLGSSQGSSASSSRAQRTGRSPAPARPLVGPGHDRGRLALQPFLPPVDLLLRRSRSRPTASSGRSRAPSVRRSGSRRTSSCREPSGSSSPRSPRARSGRSTRPPIRRRSCAGSCATSGWRSSPGSGSGTRCPRRRP